MKKKQGISNVNAVLFCNEDFVARLKCNDSLFLSFYSDFLPKNGPGLDNHCCWSKKVDVKFEPKITWLIKSKGSLAH